MATISLVYCIQACKQSNFQNKTQKTANSNSPEKKLNSSYYAFQYKSWFENKSDNYSFRRDFMNAFLHSKNSSFGDFADQEKPDWISIGPNEIAGRSLCLAIHPTDTQKIWMGSAGSGLWYSQTGGVGTHAWKNILTGFPVQAVSSIALDPHQSSNLYIGTGENYSLEMPGGGTHNRTFRGSRGIGLLKSTDNGKSWDLLLDYTDRPDLCIWKILIPQSQNKIIYLAGNMGILKTENSGETWSSIFDTCLVMDMLIQADNHNILYAGVGGIQGNKFGLYKSLDGGIHWRKIESPAGDSLDGRIMLSASKGNPQKVLAAYASAFESKGIMRSDDGFERTKYYTPIKDICAHQGWYAKCLHIKEDDPQKLLMGGVDLYYDSSGTGNKLTNLIYQKIKIHADFHDVVANPKDPNKVYFATDGGLYRSNDFGKTAFACNHGYLSAQFYKGSTNSNKEAILGGLQDNKSVYYENKQWKNIHFGDGTYNAFHPWNNEMFFVSSQFQNLYITENNGLDWKELIPPNNNAAFIAPFELNPLNPDQIFSGGQLLYISKNAGKNWSTISLENKDEKIICLLASKHISGKLIVASYHPELKVSKIYISLDEGKTLVKTSTIFKGELIRDITEHSTNPNICYLALSSFGTKGVVTSNDGGYHWEALPNYNLPNVPCHVILPDPLHPETLYAGTELGLYVSFDQGMYWESYNRHDFDMVPIYDIQYDFIQNKLILFTHGYGAFLCERVEKSIPTKSQEELAVSEFSVYLNKRLVSTIKLPSTKEFSAFTISGKEVQCLLQLNKLIIQSDLPGIYILKSKQKKAWFAKVCLY
ncbi:MAG: hypothetical protein IPM92_06805 [Saprospiraceae bacterium]|nr:hypothetical protein [Saprospiraceae bacterium]